VAGKTKRRQPAASLPKTRGEPKETVVAPASKVAVERAEILYVTGGSHSGSNGQPARRAFPVLQRTQGEAEGAYVARVASLIDEAVAEGATQLIVPQEAADWLDSHPLLTEHFVNHHELAAASADEGIVFALRPRQPQNHNVEVEVQGWSIVPGEGITLRAERRLVNPRMTLQLREPARGLLRGKLHLAAYRLPTLRLRLVLTRPDREQPRHREIVLSLARAGYVFHDLPYFEATFQEDGSVRLDFDMKLVRGRALDRIELELVEEDNWRVHPGFPGGESIALPVAARAGAWLELRDMKLEPTPLIRKGPPQGVVQGARQTPHRKQPHRPRDAVIFSSWVPREGLALGDYFIETLARWHGDSKIFVGVNHGSSPKWAERLRRSGLDVTVAAAGPDLTLPYDPSGFVAAIDAYRHDGELFDLVWFGHNKGGDHLANPVYAAARWMIERTFWSRREAIEGYFANPIIGLYTPHYLMMLQQHLTQTDALSRMYQAPCAPLYAMAVSTHFVMRDESVREFCTRVDPRFFRLGAEPYGGDRYFFEMAMPNVPIMQGYEPYIEPGLGGTKGQPKVDEVHSILSDWRQNHAVVAIELEKWRQNPTHFRTRHSEHVRVD
jgi:hypothetical protein